MPCLSDELIQQAKSVDLLSYLKSYEPNNIVRQGPNRYILRDHDSFVISNGNWCWNSRGYGRKTATALAYLMDVRGMDFSNAVHRLTDGNIQGIYQSDSSPPKPKKLFFLPIANSNNDRVIAYLRRRGIDKDIINRCIETDAIYESAKSRNIFVGFDGDTPRFACERGIYDDYKKDVAGSDKRFSFSLPPKNPNSCNLAVMESPCDVLAHATIHKMDGDKWDGYRLSLDGVGSTALISFIERHTEINSVQLCLDADRAGREAMNRIVRELLNDERFSHINIVVSPPPVGKDYADTLVAVLQLNKERTHSDRLNKAVNSI